MEAGSGGEQENKDNFALISARVSKESKQKLERLTLDLSAKRGERLSNAAVLDELIRMADITTFDGSTKTGATP